MVVLDGQGVLSDVIEWQVPEDIGMRRSKTWKHGPEAQLPKRRINTEKTTALSGNFRWIESNFLMGLMSQWHTQLNIIMKTFPLKA